MIAALAGGVGAARLLGGMTRVVPERDITVVVNTGDDTVLHGLHVSPDLDTVTYSLAGVVNPETGWGLAGETWAVMDALERYGGDTWFRLGDRDLATHLYRTQRLRDGAPLSTITSEVAASWGVGPRLLPMSDDPVRTRVTLAGNGEAGPGGRPEDTAGPGARPEDTAGPGGRPDDEAGGGFLTGVAEIEGGRRHQDAVRLPDDPLAAGLAEALTWGGHDPIYERAVGAALDTHR
jgi:hypothetical protein